jgi:hypothetical protein
MNDEHSSMKLCRCRLSFERRYISVVPVARRLNDAIQWLLQAHQLQSVTYLQLTRRLHAHGS